ncbi:hypothetical protein B0H66DRAFT_242607 [Apodospora peruviana]|uniref:Uncharacterized protein n=1 Tax=Apodospora peruviana TaxID=516989 RepID=A0AAE0I6J3_9PEZI|nr:hypothetical protein B0H66DRAFT_242607 [Apodospora peruviana]
MDPSLSLHHLSVTVVDTAFLCLVNLTSRHRLLGMSTTCNSLNNPPTTTSGPAATAVPTNSLCATISSGRCAIRWLPFYAGTAGNQGTAPSVKDISRHAACETERPAHPCGENGADASIIRHVETFTARRDDTGVGGHQTTAERELPMRRQGSQQACSRSARHFRASLSHPSKYLYPFIDGRVSALGEAWNLHDHTVCGISVLGTWPGAAETPTGADREAFAVLATVIRIFL